MKINFKERLKLGPILFDGGIGTEIYQRGIHINKCYEELNLANPSLVEQVHLDYKNAGADVITTNTFGASHYKLNSHELAGKIYEINFAGARIAKKVAGDDVYVGGSIGPLGIQLEPLGKISKEEAGEVFALQIQPLIDAEVDLLIFETFIYSDELKEAVSKARSLTNIPIIAQITIDDLGLSISGASTESMVNDLDEIAECGADIIGANCTVGPRDMLIWLEKARPLTNSPISVMPNAGKPKNIDGRNIYLTSPDYLGEYAKYFLQSGANIIGGCCGTSPAHIATMRQMINSIKPELKPNKIKFAKHVGLEAVEIIEQANKSRLSAKIARGHFATFVELLSPRGINPKKQIDLARKLYNYGIDVINIPDGPRASARMAAGALALILQREVGIETVLHFVCRDRNVIGMQSDLMGFYALGLKNILAITGDPPKLGSYPDATAVFDVDAIGLVNILSRLNHGMDIAASPIGEPTGFSIGVGCNPGSLDLENEISRLEWKVDAGAEYVITQPVFDKNIFYGFLEKISHIRVPIIAGIWPLISYRNAKFMNNEVPGVDVPDEILEKMKKWEGKKEESLSQGVEIASEILNDISPHIAGVQISAPFGKIEPVLDILDNFNFKENKRP
jgi:methionine synthase / methylenetetrahydrofolate reductase (NADH)